MSSIQLFLDATMCFSWILTYTFVLIGTIRYKYPLIPLLTQAIIAPFELSVLFWLIRDGSFTFDYATIAYTYWSAIEIVIIIVILQTRKISKKEILQSGFVVIGVLFGMVYFVIYKGYIFFFSYLNTLVGELVWIRWTLRKEYPIKLLCLLSFISKFVGDSLAVFVYLGHGPWFIDLICLFLPVLDLLFIGIYLERKSKNMKQRTYH